LEERPRLIDEHVLEQPTLPRRAERADGASIAARGEAAGVAVGQCARAGREQLRRVGGHPAAPLDLLRVQRACVLRGGIGTHLLERPGEVDRRRAGGGERLGGGVDVLPALGR
jgi:hypothetical protein